MEVGCDKTGVRGKMTREEIRDDFRTESPEITTRVITDAVLNLWMKKANREICAETRCIVTNVSETFNTVANTQYYDLEARIDNFFDVDDMPGGGVYYNDVPLEKTSPSELNSSHRLWRSNTAGTPKKWFLRGKYLWFDKKPNAAKDVDVDCVLIPNDFDADAKEPFNELGYLQVYSDGISKYLQWRCKAKVGKQEEAATAQKAFREYTAWMKKLVRSAKASAIFRRPSSYPYR